jgi:transcriptional regulator with XRE-family HTH domain
MNQMGRKPSAVGRKLRKLMASGEKPLSKAELSRRTGVPQSTINRILNGVVVDPRTRQLERLARYFGISLPDLRNESRAPVAAPSPSEDFLVYVTDAELSLIKLFRASDDEDRRAILRAAQERVGVK